MPERDREKTKKKVEEKSEEKFEGKINISNAKILSHADIIKTCHFAIADTSENRKILENHICSICAKIKCTGVGRCRATATTIAQINLLTPLVSFRDEGSPELGIESFDRVITIGDALRPFNALLSDYLNEEENLTLHALVCLADKDSNIGFGRLVIPKDYNVKVDKILKE